MAVHPAMEQTARRAVDPMVPADPAAPAGHQVALVAAVDPAAVDLAARVVAAAAAEVAANRGSNKGGIDDASLIAYPSGLNC